MCCLVVWNFVVLMLWMGIVVFVIDVRLDFGELVFWWGFLLGNRFPGFVVLGLFCFNFGFGLFDVSGCVFSLSALYLNWLSCGWVS